MASGSGSPWLAGLYRSSDLLILDDVLSAVDHTTESVLLRSISDLADGPHAPTVIIASHRLSAFRRTDVILVLDRGRMVDVGSHDELVERPGIYRDTWLAQSSRGDTETSQEAAS